MALCKDQLIGKLVALLREADPAKFDEAVATAKSRVAQNAKQAKRGDLEKLFDAQIATLKDRGCPEQIVEMLASQRNDVVARASEMSFENGCVPFLPIIPHTYLTIYSQMAMVQYRGKAGYTILDPAKITDVVATPAQPYYIFDVEDGTATCGVSPQNNEKAFKKQQKRRGLIEVEAISLCVHTDVLARHYVDAVGSRFESADRVPDVYLFDDARPELLWDCANLADGHWGSPSCGS